MQELKENKMGTMKEGKLLFSMATPMIISMLVQAMYNIVDSIFVGMYDPETNYALAAVNLSFPIQSLMIALAGGTGVGVNSLLSRFLGEKKNKEASAVAVNGIFIYAITYAVFAIVGLFGARTFFSFQSDVPEIVEYGTQYVTIVTVLGFGLFGQFIAERLLQSTGLTMYNMYTQGLGAIINIIFDPIFIFGLGPIPEMGVAGAALATVMGQIIAAIVGVYFNIRKNKEISLSLRGFRPDGRIIGMIYSVGVPSIIMQSITSLLTVGINKIVGMSPDPATVTAAQNVFGAYFKLQSFIFMPVFGLTNAMIPIIAYNYGAQKKSRIINVYKISVVSAMAYMGFGMLTFLIIPELLLSIFSLTGEAVTIGVPALRIMGTAFFFAGFSIITTSTFQALGNGVYSMIISLCRQIVVILPCSFILFKLFGLDVMWASFPIAEGVSVIMCILFAIRLYNKKLKDL